MKEGQRLWSKEELILALNLYSKLPFGKMHKKTPEIVALANLIGRTPSSIALKLGNLASFDLSLKERGIKGASNASKLDREVWDEFYGDLEQFSYGSELLLSQMEGSDFEIDKMEEDFLIAEGKMKESLVKVRVNQQFFRKMVMASYNYTCCITGINQPEVLIAGHIKPWREDRKNRLNPRNGIAINGLHDRAFEEGLLTITPDYEIKISSRLKKRGSEKLYEDYFLRYDGKSIHLPSKFLPDPALLEYHNVHRFIR